MANTTSIIGVTDDNMGTQAQSLIFCNAGGVLTSSSTSVLPTWDTSNFTVLSSGVQLKGNNTNTPPPAGYIGEAIMTMVGTGAAVSVTNGTSKNIMSISLTPGVWNVTGILGVQGILTGLAMIGSISTVSATLGTLGDNSIQTGLLNLSSAQMLVIPSYRLLLAATTTVYLVANINFTLGSPTCFGKLQGVRAA